MKMIQEMNGNTVFYKHVHQRGNSIYIIDRKDLAKEREW